MPFHSEAYKSKLYKYFIQRLLSSLIALLHLAFAVVFMERVSLRG
uniref:Uncharacterized protein n=1 Tax=Anguilla anguilla TaxID=7936 RepID=A0A0E9Q0M8_ANGAN